MPTCPVSSLRPPCLVSPFHHGRGASFARAGPSSIHVHGVEKRRPRNADFATAAAAAARRDDATSPALQRTLTLLHKTRSLLPRVLTPERQGGPVVESLEFWQELLAGASDDLSPGAVNAIRIAVHGCDELSGAEELVTALLEDPFASDPQKEAVRSRWKSVPDESKELRILGPASQDPTALQLRSAWLQRFNAPVLLVELKPPSNQTSPFFDRHALQTLFAADISIIVCNPASLNLSSLLSSSKDGPIPFNHFNAMLVITSTTHSEALAERIQSLRGYDAATLFVDPARALTALQIINVAPSSPMAVQRYQDDFERSNISSLTETIASAIASTGRAGDIVLAMHTQTARSLTQDSLATCRSVLRRAEREVAQIQDQISELECKAEEAKAKAGREVFGVPGEKGGQEDEIRKAVRVAKRDIQAVIDDLTWWKLLWRVDDVRDIVGSAVNRAWCKDLELTLAFHAGRLASLQQSSEKSSKSLLVSLLPTSPFHSSLLENKLQQISSKLSYPLDADAFSSPLHSRREQLKWPTARLHATAQQTVISMVGSTFGGLGIAWTGWAGQLGLFDIGMQLETVFGIGLLSTVAGVRWGVGRLENAKKRWWQDWTRVCEGLERDLRATLDRTMDESVLIVSKTAASDLQQLAAKRKDEIEELRHEVSMLEDELRKSD